MQQFVSLKAQCVFLHRHTQCCLPPAGCQKQVSPCWQRAASNLSVTQCGPRLSSFENFRSFLQAPYSDVISVSVSTTANTSVCTSVWQTVTGQQGENPFVPSKNYSPLLCLSNPITSINLMCLCEGYLSLRAIYPQGLTVYSSNSLLITCLLIQCC